MPILSFTPDHGPVGTTITVTVAGAPDIPLSEIYGFLGNDFVQIVSRPNPETVNIRVNENNKTGPIELVFGIGRNGIVMTSDGVFTIDDVAGPVISRFTPLTVGKADRVRVYGVGLQDTQSARVGAFVHPKVFHLADGFYFDLTKDVGPGQYYIYAVLPNSYAQSPTMLRVVDQLSETHRAANKRALEENG